MLAFGDFGGDVEWCAEAVNFFVGIRDSSDAEVGEFGVAFIIDEDVGGFDVAVDEAGFIGDG